MQQKLERQRHFLQIGKLLDFEIAMRGTGPTGLSVNLTKQEVVKVPLNKNGEAREINLEDNSDFIILENGIYKFEYYF